MKAKKGSIKGAYNFRITSAVKPPNFVRHAACLRNRRAGIDAVRRLPPSALAQNWRLTGALYGLEEGFCGTKRWNTEKIKNENANKNKQ